MPSPDSFPIPTPPVVPLGAVSAAEIDSAAAYFVQGIRQYGPLGGATIAQEWADRHVTEEVMDRVIERATSLLAPFLARNVEQPGVIGDAHRPPANRPASHSPAVDGRPTIPIAETPAIGAALDAELAHEIDEFARALSTERSVYGARGFAAVEDALTALTARLSDEWLAAGMSIEHVAVEQGRLLMFGDPADLPRRQYAVIGRLLQPRPGERFPSVERLEIRDILVLALLADTVRIASGRPRSVADTVAATESVATKLSGRSVEAAVTRPDLQEPPSVRRVRPEPPAQAPDSPTIAPPSVPQTIGD